MRADAVPSCTQAPASVASRAISCECFNDFATLATLRDDWDRFVEAVGGDVYCSFDWCRIWWRYYAYRRRLCVFIFRAAGEIVGIMPMFTDRLRLGPVVLKLAKFIGSDSTLAVLNPPVEPRRAVEVYAELLRQLLRVHGCDAVAFSPLSGERPHARTIREACRAVRGARLVRDETTTVHNVYKLPGDADAYLRGLHKTPRRDYERGWRRLNAGYQAVAETVSGAAALAAYDEFVRLHTHQWRQCHKLGHFGDWPAATEFNRDLVRTLAPLKRAGFYNLRADGDLVSSNYFLRFGAHEHWRLSARDVRPQWSRLHLGILLQVRAVETAIAAGVRRAEDGPGRYEYKTAMGALEYPLQSAIVADGVLGRLKTAVLAEVSDLLHLFYYRMWFGRIAPRVPLRRRGLWTLWTRYRV
jgi:CelD/BcsL family acetyltransferase involved in cellulose biosynthesis